MDKNNQAFPRIADILTLVNNYIHGDNFPEDDWVTFSEYWDINIWTHSDGNGYMTLYPIYFGDTDTSRGITWVIKINVKDVKLCW